VSALVKVTRRSRQASGVSLSEPALSRFLIGGASDNDTPEALRDLRVTLTKALTLADKQRSSSQSTGDRHVIDSAAKARRLIDEDALAATEVIMDAANLFHPGELGRMDEILDEAFDRLGGDVILGSCQGNERDGRAGDLRSAAAVLDWNRYLVAPAPGEVHRSADHARFEEFADRESLRFLLNDWRSPDEGSRQTAFGAGS